MSCDYNDHDYLERNQIKSKYNQNFKRQLLTSGPIIGQKKSMDNLLKDDSYQKVSGKRFSKRNWIQNEVIKTSEIDIFKTTLTGGFDTHLMNRTTSSNFHGIQRSIGGTTSSLDMLRNQSQICGEGNKNTNVSGQQRSSSTLFQTIDRGATTSLFSVKPNTIIPYFDQVKDQLKYTETGEVVSTTFTDKFNKQLIANMDPKTIQEELNIKKQSGPLS